MPAVPGAGTGPGSPFCTRRGTECQTQSRSLLLGTRDAARCNAAWYLIQPQTKSGDWMLFFGVYQGFQGLSGFISYPVPNQVWGLDCSPTGLG